MNIKLNIDYSGFIILTVVFFVLKTLGYINWAWVWIFSPLIVAAIYTVILVIIYKIIKKRYS